MDPPSKRRRLAPKLPDPPPPAPAPSSVQSLQPPQPLQPLSDQATAPIYQTPPTHDTSSVSSRLFANPPPSPPAAPATAPDTSAPSALPASSSPPTSAERHDFQMFAKHLQDAAMYIYRQGQKLPYAHVSALLLRWDDDVAAAADVSSLEHVLRDRYNFHTECWGIPATANPTAKLGIRVANFLNQASADHLLILYYFGHGYSGSDNHLYWACNARDDSPKIKWDGVRSLFDDAQSDILVLLDSCAPKDTPVGGSHGVKQAIVAFTPEAGPRDRSTRSFTSYLTESLTKLCNGRPFNVRRLYDEILATKKLYERKYTPRSSLATSPPPFFVTLTSGRGQSLDLMPIPRLPLAPQNGVSSDANPPTFGRDTPVISPAAVADMVFDEARVLVCTTFVRDTGPDMACFNHWIHNTPLLASHLALEGMFLGPPTVLLISISRALWDIVQHDNICSFLGYINSGNLIHLYDGLIRAATASVPQAAQHFPFMPPPNHSSPPPIYVSAKDVEDGQTLLEARQAATNNGCSNVTRAYQNEPYQHPHQQNSYQAHQAHQAQQQQPSLPPPSQLLQSLPPPNLHNQSTHHISSPLHNRSSSASQFESDAVQRSDLFLQLQHTTTQRQPTVPHLPPLTSLNPVLSQASPAATNNESEESAEMKEAAEQLEALSHIRPANDSVSPSFPAASSQLLQIAHDAMKCQEGDFASDDTEGKAVARVRSPAPKRAKQEKEHQVKNGQAHDEPTPHSLLPRPSSDLSSTSLPKLLAQGSKQEVQCNWCSHQPFKDPSSLRKHIASTHTRPFPCAFAFAGCMSTFGSKNEWKRHITSQHLCLQYYRCSSCSQTAADGKGNEFNRKDLFTQHLRRMHAPFYIRKSTQQRDSKTETDWEDHVREMQKTCCIIRRHPPQRSACPMPGCNRLFDGSSAWDEWTEHVGRHMENGEGVSLGIDELLVSWALDEGIIMQEEDGGYRLRNPPGNGSGNGNGSGSGSYSSSGSNGSNDNSGSNNKNGTNGSSSNMKAGPHAMIPVDAGASGDSMKTAPSTPHTTSIHRENEEHQEPIEKMRQTQMIRHTPEKSTGLPGLEMSVEDGEEKALADRKAEWPGATTKADQVAGTGPQKSTGLDGGGGGGDRRDRWKMVEKKDEAEDGAEATKEKSWAGPVIPMGSATAAEARRPQDGVAVGVAEGHETQVDR